MFKACEAINLCKRRYNRWCKSIKDNRGGYRNNPTQKLSDKETSKIIQLFTMKEYCNLPINIAHAKLMSSHSRPHTSNDNAFAESVFATMKGRVIYPEFFNSIESVELFVSEFMDWYNNEHLHSGLDLLSPSAVHFGYHDAILKNRNKLLEEA